MIDVNKDTGAYHSFSDVIRTQLQKSGVYKSWATYTTNPQTRQADSEGAPPPRGSILPMEFNPYMEPLLPKGWRTPPKGQAPYKHYQELIRSYVTYTQGASPCRTAGLHIHCHWF